MGSSSANCGVPPGNKEREKKSARPLGRKQWRRPARISKSPVMPGLVPTERTPSRAITSATSGRTPRRFWQWNIHAPDIVHADRGLPREGDAMRTPASIAAAVAVVGLVGCASVAHLPFSAGVGADPQLPSPETALIPTVHIAPAKGWPEGGKPEAAA